MAGADIRSLDLAMLRAFEALLAERSVSKAGARLFLSQPAVSASLKRLREVFDDPLFTRTAHGVEPTPRALALAPHVHAALNEINRLFTAGQAFDPARSDRIFRIVGSDHMTRTVLRPLATELAQMGSGIRISWEAANYAALPERLRQGEADIGLLPRLTPPSGLAAQWLYEDEYLLVARASDRDEALTLERFCERPHVSLGYGRSYLEDRIDQLVEQAGRSRHTQLAVTSFAQIVDLVSQTEHLAVLPGLVAHAHAERLSLHPLPFELPRYALYLCCGIRFESDPGIAWMRERLGQIILAQHSVSRAKRDASLPGTEPAAP